MKRITVIISIVLAIAIVGVAFQITEAQRSSRSGRGRPVRGTTDTSSIERSPIPKTEEEKKILSVLEDLEKYRGEFQNVSPEDGRLLRLLTEATGAKHVVEIGASNGYSAIWFCLALRTTGGKLTT